MPNEMITCPKCHGNKFIEYPVYFADGTARGLEKDKCLLCRGTGKVTLEFYEELQKRYRGEDKCKN